MSAIVKLDTIDGSQLTVRSTTVERIRTGTITNIPVSGVPDIFILEKAYQAVTALVPFGSTFPSNSGWVMHSLRVWPMSGNSCRFEMVYSTVDWGTTVYLITDETYLETIETEFLPGLADKVPLLVSFRFPAIGNSPGGLIKDAVRFALPLPVRAITITQISFGNPPTSVRPFVGYVNSEANYLSTPGVGMWKILRYKSELSKFQSSYAVESTIATRTSGDDWSYFGVLQNRQTGQYADTTFFLPAALALPYSYGIIYPQGANYADAVSGFIRVGPSKTTSFNSLFPGLDPTQSIGFGGFGGF